jgi:hypothetical protein
MGSTRFLCAYLLESVRTASAPVGALRYCDRQVELQRGRGKNPALPEWLAEDYFKAIESLAQAGLAELPNSSSVELSRAILSLLGVWKALGVSTDRYVCRSDAENAAIGR